MPGQYVYSNKMAVIQVIGALANNPFLLEDDKYRFFAKDFPEDFHRYVFKAIVGIATQSDGGNIDIDRIDPIEVEQWLKNYPEWYQVFVSNDGVNWMKRAMSAYVPGKLHYYYNQLKKYSLLNAMVEKGIDTRPILDPTLVDPVEVMKRQERFDAMTIRDLISTVEMNVLDLKEKYDSSENCVESQAADGLDDLLESLEEAPEIGPAFRSRYLTTAYRGARRGTVLVETAPQGVGKSREQAGESAHFAVPLRYDLKKKAWVKDGYNLKTLLISSELTRKEVQYMWLAYLTGIEEERIAIHDISKEEEERLRVAKDLLRNANLYFVEISNYDITDIENVIKRYVLAKDVGYVFFDYVGSTLKIMSSSSRDSRMSNLREDQILLMFMDRLKNNLAKQLDIFIYTATQVSGNWKEVKEADQQMIRGAKSIADKPDGGWVLLPVRESDKAIVDQYKAKGFVQEPTHVMHVYKNRGNPLVNIRIYGYFQRNTCRWYDCFVTDFTGKMLEIQPTEVTWDEEDEPQSPVRPIPLKPEKKAPTAPLEAPAAMPDFGEKPSKAAAKEDYIMPINDELPFDFSDEEPTATGWGKNMSSKMAEQPPSIPSFAITEPTQTEPEQKPDEAKPAWGASAFDPNDF